MAGATRLDPTTAARGSFVDRPRRWVHLPVEVQAREFDSRLLLACVAAERGYGSVIGQKAKLAQLAAALPRGSTLRRAADATRLTRFEHDAPSDTQSAASTRKASSIWDRRTTPDVASRTPPLLCSAGSMPGATTRRKSFTTFTRTTPVV